MTTDSKTATGDRASVIDLSSYKAHLEIARDSDISLRIVDLCLCRLVLDFKQKIDELSREINRVDACLDDVSALSVGERLRRDHARIASTVDVAQNAVSSLTECLRAYRAHQ